MQNHHFHQYHPQHPAYTNAGAINPRPTPGAVAPQQAALSRAPHAIPPQLVPQFQNTRTYLSSNAYPGQVEHAPAVTARPGMHEYFHQARGTSNMYVPQPTQQRPQLPTLPANSFPAVAVHPLQTHPYGQPQAPIAQQPINSQQIQQQYVNYPPHHQQQHVRQPQPPPGVYPQPQPQHVQLHQPHEQLPMQQPQQHVQVDQSRHSQRHHFQPQPPAQTPQAIPQPFPHLHQPQIVSSDSSSPIPQQYRPADRSRFSEFFRHRAAPSNTTAAAPPTRRATTVVLNQSPHIWGAQEHAIPSPEPLANALWDDDPERSYRMAFSQLAQLQYLHTLGEALPPPRPRQPQQQPRAGVPSHLQLPEFEFSPECDISETICVVCQCDFEAGDVVQTTPCVHNFHRDCVAQWFREKNFCPTCREVVEG